MIEIGDKVIEKSFKDKGDKPRRIIEIKEDGTIVLGQVEDKKDSYDFYTASSIDDLELIEKATTPEDFEDLKRQRDLRFQIQIDFFREEFPDRPENLRSNLKYGGLI